MCLSLRSRPLTPVLPEVTGEPPLDSESYVHTRTAPTRCVTRPAVVQPGLVDRVRKGEPESDTSCPVYTRPHLPQQWCQGKGDPVDFHRSVIESGCVDPGRRWSEKSPTVEGL